MQTSISVVPSSSAFRPFESVQVLPTFHRSRSRLPLMRNIHLRCRLINVPRVLPIQHICVGVSTSDGPGHVSRSLDPSFCCPTHIGPFATDTAYHHYFLPECRKIAIVRQPPPRLSLMGSLPALKKKKWASLRVPLRDPLPCCRGIPADQN